MHIGWISETPYKGSIKSEALSIKEVGEWSVSIT